MKKYFKFTFMAAIATIAMGGVIVGCASDDVVEEPNPDYNTSTGAVKVDFALNIGRGAATRMTSANTQQDGTFRGMTGVTLLSYNAAPSSSSFVTDGAFAMGDITGITATASSKVYTMYIPTGTSNFLFYAKAKDTTPGFAQGSLTYNVSSSTTDPANINFSLNPIAQSSDLTGSGKPEDVWLTYLNSISGTTDWAGTIATAVSNPDYEAISKAYTAFTNTPGDARQGSAQAILRTVQDLYKVMGTIVEGGTAPSAVVTIAKAVMDNIDDGTLIEVTNKYTSGATVAFKSTDNSIINFPAEQKLPMGAAALTCTSGTFSYNNTGANVFGATLSTNIFNICYPSELTYWANSPLLATASSQKTSDYPATVSYWDAEASWASATWNQMVVGATTRAVAMKYNVKYGVALLNTSVKLTNGTYKDNANIITDGEISNQDITITDGSFKIKGIIIGGQPTQVDYQFLKTSSGTYDKVVYDLFSTSGTNLAAATAVENYTLLLDNYTVDATQKTVNIALELVNNTGADFYGKDGVIGNGQTFYLCGTLTPDAGTWTDSECGVGYPVNKTKRVFAQDFMTHADITVGTLATTLQNAYSTLPDLRSTQMTFGLSVDLTWKSGLTFTQTW